MLPHKLKNNPNRNTVGVYNRLQRYGLAKSIRCVDESIISTIRSVDFIDEHNNVLTTVISSNDNEYDCDTLLYEVSIYDSTEAPKLMVYYTGNSLSLLTSLNSIKIYGVMDGGNYVVLGSNDCSDIIARSHAQFNYTYDTDNIPSVIKDFETTDIHTFVFYQRCGLFLIHDDISKRHYELTDLLTFNKNDWNIPITELINSTNNSSFITITT